MVTPVSMALQGRPSRGQRMPSVVTRTALATLAVAAAAAVGITLTVALSGLPVASAADSGFLLSPMGTTTVSLGDSPTVRRGGKSVTVAAWIRLDALEAESHTSVVYSDRGQSAAGGDSGVLMGVDTGLLHFDTHRNGGTRQLFAPAGNEVSVGVWTHVAATYDLVGGDANGCVLYVDGEAVASSSEMSDSVETDADGTNAMLLHDPATGAYFFDGAIDDFMLWSVSLPAAAITALLDVDACALPGQEAIGGFGDLLVWLRFDDQTTVASGMAANSGSDASVAVATISHAELSRWDTRDATCEPACAEGSFATPASWCRACRSRASCPADHLLTGTCASGATADATCTPCAICGADEVLVAPCDPSTGTDTVCEAAGADPAKVAVVAPYDAADLEAQAPASRAVLHMAAREGSLVLAADGHGATLRVCPTADGSSCPDAHALRIDPGQAAGGGPDGKQAVSVPLLNAGTVSAADVLLTPSPNADDAHSDGDSAVSLRTLAKTVDSLQRQVTLLQAQLRDTARVADRAPLQSLSQMLSYSATTIAVGDEATLAFPVVRSRYRYAFEIDVEHSAAGDNVQTTVSSVVEIWRYNSGHGVWYKDEGVSPWTVSGRSHDPYRDLVISRPTEDAQTQYWAMQQSVKIRNLGPQVIVVYAGGAIQDVSHGSAGTVFVQDGWV